MATPDHWSGCDRRQSSTTANSYVGWPSYAVALVVAAVFAAGYLRASGERSVLE